MTTYEMPVTTCPVCYANHDRATTASGDGAPEPGSMSVCVRCHTILVFTPGLSLRIATTAEAAALQRENPALFAAIVSLEQER